MTFQSNGFEFLKDIEVRLSVELGQTEMKLRDAVALGAGSVVTLDRLTDELLDVMVNGKAIARGEVVAMGERFGLRIVEMLGSEAEAMPPMPADAAMPPQADPAVQMAAQTPDAGAAG